MQIVIPFRGPAVAGTAPPNRTDQRERRLGRPALRAGRFSRESLENILSMAALLGDFAVILLSLAIAYWIRFGSGLIPRNTSLPVYSLADCYKEMLLGAVIVFSGLSRRAL